MIDWDRRFIDQAYHVSLWSKDRSTKVGAVIARDKHIISSGYNGPPRGVDDEDPYYHDREGDKYHWFEHAERNAIYQAAKLGVSAEGATLYSTHPPCADCARGIVQSGITRVVSIPADPRLEEAWGHSLGVGREIFSRCGVEYGEIV